MDKSKWEYKKLGEVCTMYQPKTISTQELVDDGDYLVYGANGIIGRYDKYNHEQSEILMTCRGATCGTINISEPFSWINGNAMVIHPTNNDYVRDFLVYQLKAVDKSSVITGAAQPQITRQMLQTLPVVIAPIADQQRIVAELDCLNEMIAVKQEQLKEFDKLAQSIFYDMFGDPISNSKKWKTIKLEKITKAEGGGTPSKNNPDYWGGDIVWVTSKDMKQMYISDSQIHITEAGVNNSPAHILPIGTILLVNRSGILKHTLPLALTTKEVTINQDLKALTITDERFLSLFILYTLKGFTPYLLSRVKAVTVDSIEFSVFKKLEIPLPPLSLQQQFADKISAIEAQKELIKQSIAETQHLFDSKMDYYFD